MNSKIIAEDYIVQEYNTIEDIPKSLIMPFFEQIESDNTERCYEWLMLTEKYSDRKIKPFYFLINDESNTPVGLWITFLIPNMEFTYKGVEGIDDEEFNVLKINTLLSNFPLSNYNGLFLKDESFGNRALELLLDKLENYVKPDSVYLGPFDHLNMIKYQELIPEEFIQIPYFTIARLKINVSTFDDYLGELKAKVRWDVKQKISVFEEFGATIEYCKDTKPIAETLHQLFLNTEASNSKFDLPFLLTPKFFEEMTPYLGKRFEVILAKKDDKIFAFGLIIKKKNNISLKFVGMDYDLSKESYAYFNIFYEVIRHAINNNYDWANFGATSLFNKKRLNCELYEQEVAIGGYPLKMFKMFKSSGMMENKFVSKDYFSKHNKLS